MDTSVVPHSQTNGNVIVVDPRTDTLYDVFDWQTYDIDYATGAFMPTDLHFAVVKSTDQGRTWSKPVTVTKDRSVPEVEANANAPQDFTDACSGLFPTGTDCGPAAAATVAPRVKGLLGSRPHRLVRWSKALTQRRCGERDFGFLWGAR
ncbi:hypothetical protein ACH4UM_19550 [Streptomyces sp. NPDC020801]|uniref:hypothetical protein n=1 Tax=unclassified Streptomyces TaxID=2593676 RepID=UPI00378954FC